MTSPTSPTPADQVRDPGSDLRPSADSDLTWLLHRAAQHLRGVTSEQAGKSGLQMREYIILGALSTTADLTQADLGKALGLDKTTLTSQLDRLERGGLIERHLHPRDRRLRIPVITPAGAALCAEVSAACAAIEAEVLADFAPEHVRTFRHMLVAIIGDGEDPGSCL
jgi:DNA-binding MarR family transcriptional regulator